MDCQIWLYSADNPDSTGLDQQVALVCKTHDVLLDAIKNEDLQARPEIVQQVIKLHQDKWKDFRWESQVS